MNDTRTVLDQLIRDRGEDYASLSRLLGRNAAYIQQFIRRGTPRKLDEEDRRTLARYFRVDEAVLGGPPALIVTPTPRGRNGAVNDRGAGWTAPRPARRAVAELIRIPRLAVRASAGAGTLDPDEFDVSSIGLTPAFLRTLCSDPGLLSMIQVTKVMGVTTIAAINRYCRNLTKPPTSWSVSGGGGGFIEEYPSR